MQESSVILAAASAALVAVGCAPVYSSFDENAPDSPGLVERQWNEIRLQEGRRRLKEAEAAREAGRPQRALAVLEDLVTVDPTFTPAWIAIGQLRLDRGDHAGAEEAFRRATRLEPRNYDARYGSALALQLLGRLPEAVDDYFQALTIRPESPEANLAIATAYLQMDRPDSAVVFAEKSVELDPSSGPARVSLGAAYERLGRPAEAVAQYRAALERMAPTAPLLVNLVNVLIAVERYEDARDAAIQLVRLSPSAPAYERLGWVYSRLGAYDESMDAYRKALEIDARHWPALNGIGSNAISRWLLSEKRDAVAAGEARQAFRRSLQINPDQPRIIRILLQHGL